MQTTNNTSTFKHWRNHANKLSGASNSVGIKNKMQKGVYIGLKFSNHAKLRATIKNKADYTIPRGVAEYGTFRSRGVGDPRGSAERLGRLRRPARRGRV